MPSTNDRVTLFLNATNTAVAVLSLAFTVWLQFSASHVPAEADLAVCVALLAEQDLEVNFAAVPPVHVRQPQ